MITACHSSQGNGRMKATHTLPSAPEIQSRVSHLALLQKTCCGLPFLSPQQITETFSSHIPSSSSSHFPSLSHQQPFPGNTAAEQARRKVQQTEFLHYPLLSSKGNSPPPISSPSLQQNTYTAFLPPLPTSPGDPADLLFLSSLCPLVLPKPQLRAGILC